jgi:hypothetical protein
MIIYYINTNLYLLRHFERIVDFRANNIEIEKICNQTYSKIQFFT